MAEPQSSQLTLLQTAMTAAIAGGATYAEVRSVASDEVVVAARDGHITTHSQQHDVGWGIRVAVKGPHGLGWGFAATARWTTDAAVATAREALAIANASLRVPGIIATLDNLPTKRGTYTTAIVRDPLQVPIAEQMDLVIAATNAQRAASQRIVSANATVHTWRTEKHFMNTLGADLHQTISEVEGNIAAIAQDDSGYTYRRSYENMLQGGWEHIDALQLISESQRIGLEAAELVVAPWVDEGPQTVVVGADFVSLLLHESCGHPTELDRALGWEAAFAGTSFLMPDMLNTFPYGSAHVNITADSTTPGGLGTFGWDDEGTPAQRWDLVRDGIFVGYLSSRESAPIIGQRSNGCGRASGWNRMPIVRMVNVSLEPQQGTLADLIGDVEEGVYVDTPSSWSLDDKRMNFHFSGELCREIHHGKLGDYRKGAAFQSRTPTFWNSCRAVGGPESWRLRGFAQCAKGEPLQLAHVAHGASPIIVTDLPITRG